MASKWRMFRGLSRGLARVELILACLLLCIIIALLIASVVMRATGMSLFWADEVMTNLMCAMAILAASALVEERNHARVDLMIAVLPGSVRVWIDRMAAFATLLFACVLLWLSLRLFQPVAMIEAKFSIDTFTATTRNFIYNEPLTTLGIARFWTWLPLPFAAFGMMVHALSWLQVSWVGAKRAPGAETIA